MLRRKRRIVFVEDKRLHVLQLIIGSAMVVSGIVMIILLSVLLSGCSTIDDDASDCPAGTSADAIAFGLSDDATRTAQGTTDLAALRTQGFGVFACHTGLHPYISTSTTPNLMYNQLVGYDDVNGVWTYSPLVYWPNGDDGADEYVTFFAYGPHSSAASGCIVDMSRPDEVGDPWILYQLGGSSEADGVDGWKACQVDLVYDFQKDQKRTYPISSNRIDFNFKHALSCIGDQVTVSVGESVKTRLKGIYTGSPVTLTVSTITIDYLLTRKGRLILNNSTQPNWQAVESEDQKVHRLLSYTPNLMMAQATSSTACSVNSFSTGEGNGVFYIPLESGSEKQKVTVRADYTVTTGSPTYTIAEGTLEATVDLSYISNASQGRNLNVTIQIPEIACSGAELTSATVGQIICSHGKAFPATVSNLVCGGKKVAMVAYKGDAGGESSPYNHGLAIALDDATTAAWCSQKANTCLDAQATNLASALTTLNGLTATAQLVADDSHTHAAATAARNYCYDVSASAGAHPTGTSTWFLPSLGQWNIMLKAMTGSGVDLSSSSNATYQAANVSPLITAAGGTALSAAHYWSSTEKSATDAWDVTFQNGRSNGADKDTGTCRVRAVLAF